MNSTTLCAGVRERAGVFDRSAEGRLEVRGEERATWLQGLLSNDVVALSPGEGCYAAYLTPQGRMIADVRVVALHDRFWLDVPAGLAASLRDRFESLVIMEDVLVDDISTRIARLAVHGPDTADIVAAALGGAARLVTGGVNLADLLADGKEHRSLVVDLVAVPEPQDMAAAGGDAVSQEVDRAVVVASRDLGLPGVDVYVAAPRAEAVVGATVEAGAVAIDADTWHQMRVEAGRPWFGVDMTTETIPLEAGIEDRAISFTKGCYVGQEVIVRVRDRGQGRVAKRLVGLEASGLSDPATVPAGTRLLVGGRDVGVLTSVVWSPARNAVVALGYTHRDFVDAGTRVEAEAAVGRIDFVVTALPFVASTTGAGA